MELVGLHHHGEGPGAGQRMGGERGGWVRRLESDDEGGNSLINWDPVWNDHSHILIGLNALMDPLTGKAIPELDEELKKQGYG